jgi:AP-1 complex subunit mu
MVASAIYFLDLKGKVLLQRNYRGDIPEEAAERFMNLLNESDEEQRTSCPVIYENGLNYVYLRHNNLYSKYELGDSSL